MSVAAVGERSQRLLLIGCSVVFAALALLQARSDGLTYDEGFYLTSGLHALVHHDLRVVPESPPLSHVVAAAPVLLMHPAVPRGSSWRRADRRAMTADLLGAQGGVGRLHRIISVARLVPILETIATAWCMALLAGRLVGRRAGALAGVLWLANPFVLGLGHLDAMDVPAALTTVLVALAVLRALRTPDRRAVAMVGLAGGVAVLTRTTGLLVVAGAVLAVEVDAWSFGLRRAASRAAVVLGVAWCTVGVGYFLATPGPMPKSGRSLLTSVGRLVLPPDWLTGMGRLMHSGSVPGAALVLGHVHVGRWPIFWPLMLLLKLPLPTVALIALAPFVLTRLETPQRRELALVVGMPAALLTAFVLQQERPIGLRYLAASLALLLVAASTVAVVVPGRVRVGITVLVVAVGAWSVLAQPALSWTPPMLGPGYRLAADSNLDWGQSYPELARWTASHPAWVDYFGPPGIGVAGLPNARSLRSAPPLLTGWVAVSASSLTVYSRGRLAWLRAYCPVSVIGRTILVYRFANPPDRHAHGEDVPPPPCPGPTSQRVLEESG